MRTARISVTTLQVLPSSHAGGMLSCSTSNSHPASRGASSRPPAPKVSSLLLTLAACFFAGMASNADKVPDLPDEAYTRESFYPDHD